MQTNPNILQRKAANPKESAWVAASAGSGKTKVLSDRVLNLLLTQTPPEKILCLTFTRTAAAQMANKIAERLAGWAAAEEEKLVQELTDLTGTPPDSKQIARARRLFARLLDTAGGLKATTLHGFCQSLLKRFPLEAGVSPQFDVLDERGAKELIEQAQNKILALPEFASQLEIVTAATNEDGFLDVLTEMTTHLPELKQITAACPSPEKLKSAYETALNLPPGATQESLTAAFCTLSSERRAELKQAVTVLNASTKDSDRKTAQAIADFLISKPTDIYDYLFAFLTKDGAIRKRLVCKESENILPVILAEAQRAEILFQQQASVQTLVLSLALFDISSAILNEYITVKNDRAVMDYDDLIAAAKGLLEKSGAAAWVLFKLDGGVDHILVDEAQDTSPDQWAIIRSLAEEFFAGQTARTLERTIFAVGDKKQSIFSFQGADPDEFEKMRCFFKEKVEQAGKAWNDVPMYISFRSVPAVIDAVNFVLRNPKAICGVVDKNEDATHLSWRKKQAGMVELWPTEKPQQNDTQKAFTKPVERVFSQTPSARLARKMAQRIADMVHNKERLESQNRPIRPGDILILVRHRNAFIEDLSRELKTLGVPVSGIDRLKITTHIAVMDLMVLGDFLLLPEDDLALATVLRSPLCGISGKDLSADDLKRACCLDMPLDGISEDDLFTLAYGRGEQTLYERLKTYEDSPETPLGKAYLFLRDLLSRVDKMRPYELFAYVLGPLGRQKNFIARLGVQALDALDEFMSLALQYDSMQSPSLQNFLRYLRQNDVEIKRDPEQTSLDAVRIMTVHAAKGLQAPIVFLPDTRQLRFHAPKTVWPKTANDRAEVALWAPKAAYRDTIVNKELEKLKEKNQREYNRLLYVALTRAADRLYITGWDTKNIPPDNWYDLTRGALSLENEDGSVSYHAQEIKTDLFDDPVLRLVSIQEESVKPAVEQNEKNVFSPLPDWISQPAPTEPTPTKPLTPSKPDIEEPAALSPLSEGRLNALKRGTAVHALLEILPQYPADKRPAAAEKILSLHLPEADKAERSRLTNDVLNILNTPDFKALFASNSFAEVPVSGKINDRVVSGKIDRLAVTEHDVLIVDYKSNHSVPESVSETPEAYLRQAGLYKALLTQIYPGKTVRCFLLWTEEAKLCEITPLVCDRMEY